MTELMKESMEEFINSEFINFFINSKQVLINTKASVYSYTDGWDLDNDVISLESLKSPYPAYVDIKNYFYLDKIEITYTAYNKTEINIIIEAKEIYLADDDFNFVRELSPYEKQKNVRFN